MRLHHGIATKQSYVLTLNCHDGDELPTCHHTVMMAHHRLSVQKIYYKQKHTQQHTHTDTLGDLIEHSKAPAAEQHSIVMLRNKATTPTLVLASAFCATDISPPGEPNRTGNQNTKSENWYLIEWIEKRFKLLMGIAECNK